MPKVEPAKEPKCESEHEADCEPQKQTKEAKVAPTKDAVKTNVEASLKKAITPAEQEPKCKKAEDTQGPGPDQGFDSSKCEGHAPKAYNDPVCFEGKWIEHEDLNSPDFWACGKKPLDMEYPSCNFETGKWEDYVVHEDVDDQETCGAMPDSDDFLVCNHDSMKWEVFHVLAENDFEVCGAKPKD